MKSLGLFKIPFLDKEFQKIKITSVGLLKSGVVEAAEKNNKLKLAFLFSNIKLTEIELKYAESAKISTNNRLVELRRR